MGGAPLIYTYTGVNNGPDGAVNVRILSNYSEPPNSISTSRGTCGLSSPPTVTRPSRPRPVPATYLTCEVGSLGSGENVVVTVQVTASAGTQSNGASIQGSVTDPDLTNNSDAEATTVLGIPTTQRIRPTIIRPPRPTIIRPSRGETTSTTSTTTSSTTSTTVAP